MFINFWIIAVVIVIVFFVLNYATKKAEKRGYARAQKEYQSSMFELEYCIINPLDVRVSWSQHPNNKLDRSTQSTLLERNILAAGWNLDPDQSEGFNLQLVRELLSHHGYYHVIVERISCSTMVL